VRRLLLVAIFLMTAVSPAAAQLGKRISVRAGTPEDQAIAAISKATSPQQKLTLLDKFAADHPSGDMALMADRMYVDTYMSLKNYPKVYEYGDKALAIDPNDLQVAVSCVRAAQLQNNTAKLFSYGLQVGEMAARYKAEPPPAGYPADEWAAQKQQALASAKPSIDWVAGVLFHAAATAPSATQRAAYLEKFIDAFSGSTYAENAEYHIAEAYHRAGQNEKMLAFVKKRVAANPDDVGMQLLLADYLSTKGTELDQAETSANKVIQLLSTAQKPAGMADAQWQKQSSNQKGLAYSALGQVYVNQKKDDEAVKAFEQAKPLLVGSTENSARNLYRLGYTLAKMKRYTEARAALEEAAKPNTPYRAMSEKLLRTLPRTRRR
jgi:tetratricopeptide (TPR) repeat protein